MQSERSREIQVGVMVVLGVAILVVGLMFFKRVNLSTDMVPYAVDFPAVEGLRKGDRVQVRGIRVGQVERFEFLPGAVRVHIEIEDWVELHPDADATLVMKGLVGEVLVEFEPGTADGSVSPGHIFEGRNAASMLAVGDKVNDSLDQMKLLGEELRVFLADLRESDLIANADSTLETAQATLGDTRALIVENRESLRELTGNLNDLTITLERALGDGKLDSTLATTRGAAASLDSAMVELRAATTQARDLLAGLERGEGTVGRLLTDDTLYDRADSTLLSLDRLLDRIRRDPRSMFKMSVF
jgi:phospholipid/cholesterol/gamma-HCH transport system substrate-binding protein